MFTLDASGTEITVESDAAPVRVAGGWILDGAEVSAGSSASPVRFYRHGWHSWSLAHWANVDAEPLAPRFAERSLAADDPVILAMGHAGRGVGALETSDGDGLVLGALGLDAIVALDGGRLVGTAPAGTRWLLATGAADAGLERYAAELGATLGSVRSDPGNVWCSWYSFYRSITEAAMNAVLTGLEGLAFDVVQIDDGWQQAIGDWVANDDFPGGMGAMADRIAASGYRPGLWLAPFVAEFDSEVLHDHPDWFVKGPDDAPLVAGTNWSGYCALDVTHPEARDYIADAVQRAVQWGYTYLKLDFLYATAMPGGRHDAIGREAAYRSGIELVRSTVGHDVYLLGCGAPITPSIGVFNGIRVGPDVAPYWENDLNVFVNDFTVPAARFALSTSLSRWWLRDVIAVDPDVAYFRSRYNLLSPAQRRLLADMCHISGFRATSDPPAWLDGEERDELARFLTERPTVTRVGRHQWNVGGRLVDISAATLDGMTSLRAGGEPIALFEAGDAAAYRSGS